MEIGVKVMTQHKVVVKPIVSSDSKVIAEAKNLVIKSDDGKDEISQSISANFSSSHSSSSYIKSSSSSFFSSVLID